MTTLFGPHLLQVPNTTFKAPLAIRSNINLNTFRDSLNAWEPPVCLLTLDILDGAYSKGWNEPAGTPQKSIVDAAKLSVTDLRALIVGHSGPLNRGTSREQALRYYVQPILETSCLASMQLIGRIFIDDSIVAHHIKEDPEATAQYHHNLVMASRMILDEYNKPGLDTRVDYWVIANEVLANTDAADLDALARYERRRMELAGTDYGCGLFAFATGHPVLLGPDELASGIQEYDMGFKDGNAQATDIAKLSRWQRSRMHDVLKDANEYNRNSGTNGPKHVVLLHQYFKPDIDALWVNSTDITLTPLNYSKFVGRFEHHVYDWFQHTYPDLKVIMSEYGADGRINYVRPKGVSTLPSLGWKYYDKWLRYPSQSVQDSYDGAPYLTALRNLDAHSQEQKYFKVIKGYCLFALGVDNLDIMNSEFWSYRLEPGELDSEDVFVDVVAKEMAEVVTGLVDSAGQTAIPSQMFPESLHRLDVQYGDFNSGHLKGRWSVQKVGEHVAATFSSKSSLVHVKAGGRLCELPADFVPYDAASQGPAAVTFQVEGALKVDANGQDDPSDDNVYSFELEVRANGEVHYVGNTMQFRPAADPDSTPVNVTIATIYFRFNLDAAWTGYTIVQAIGRSGTNVVAGPCSDQSLGQLLQGHQAFPLAFGNVIQYNSAMK